MKWRAVVGHEIKSVGVVTLYFLSCFGIILTLKKLFLADYHIESYALSAAVVGAIVAAKVVVTLDHTRAGTRFDARGALVTAVSYKTLVYGVVAFGVLLAERLFHAYRASDGLGVAIAEVWAHRDRNVIFAKVICVGLTFAGYHLYMGIDRRLGEGTLWRVLGSQANPLPRAGPKQGSPRPESELTDTRKEQGHGRTRET